jgi:hypothetical protein
MIYGYLWLFKKNLLILVISPYAIFGCCKFILVIYIIFGYCKLFYFRLLTTSISYFLLF